MGLKRRGFSREVINSLRAAYRLLFAEEGTFQERVEDVAGSYRRLARGDRDHPDFIRAESGRPLCHAAAGDLTAAMSKLGLIAGGGGLPLEIAQACTAAERPLFVVRIKGSADTDLEVFAGAESGIAELGRSIRLLKQAGCEAVCFAGQVSRPDFAALKPDLRGLAALPGVIAAASRGDDELLRFMMGEFERDGFIVEGADQVVADLAIGQGALGRHAPTDAHQLDIETAVRAARALGDLDIGQAAVSARGLVLAMEAAEGTARCSGAWRACGRS